MDASFLPEIINILDFFEKMPLDLLNGYFKTDPPMRLMDFRGNSRVIVNAKKSELLSASSCVPGFSGLETIKPFVDYLFTLEAFPPDIAKRIISVEDFQLLFQEHEALRLYFSAESYEDCAAYYKDHYAVLHLRQASRNYYIQSLPKLGNYVGKIVYSEEDDVQTLLAILRFLWQKGSFESAQKVSTLLEIKCAESDLSQACFLLNSKVRILRDIGQRQTAKEQLELFACRLDKIDHSVNSVETYRILKAKYLYNEAIEAFLDADFKKCVTLSNESLTWRDAKQYSAPYLLLREARCYIFCGDINNYQKIMDEIVIDASDKWANALKFTVQSEYCRYYTEDLYAAEVFLSDANQLESQTGADIIYTNISLLFFGVQLGRESEIIRLLQIVSQYPHIEAKIAVKTGNIGLSIIRNKDAAPAIGELSEDPTILQYPFYLFESLFSLAKLCQQYQRDFPIQRQQLSFLGGISKQLQSAFSKKPSVIIIYSWWDKEHHPDDENKTWVQDLNTFLRNHGIDSVIDEKWSMENTADSSAMIEEKEYDKYIVVLTEGLKTRVSERQGVLFTEYEKLLTILEKDERRIIFLARGSNESISPADLLLYTKIPFEERKPFNPDEEAAFGVLRRVKDIPYYDKSFPLVDDDILPQRMC